MKIGLRDTGPQTYRGHDFYLSGSRDVIGHVTIRFSIMPFLIGRPLEPSLYLQPFRDIRPNITLTNTRTNKQTRYMNTVAD